MSHALFGEGEFSEDELCLSPDEVPCLDVLPKEKARSLGYLKNCVIERLKKQCGKALGGKWLISENISIQQIGKKFGKQDLVSFTHAGILCFDSGEDLNQSDTDEGIPSKVLIRVYGEVLRNNLDSLVLDSVIFALLSEKRLGPRLYGVFRGGRIEEYIASRPLRTDELRIPCISAEIARHLARLHLLNMPLPKSPVFLFKMLARFLRQLTKDRCHRVSQRETQPFSLIEQASAEKDQHEPNITASYSSPPATAVPSPPLTLISPASWDADNFSMGLLSLLSDDHIEQ
ncbi:unnamed protein product, partial [Protopolystoma xenopodis]